MPRFMSSPYSLSLRCHLGEFRRQSFSNWVFFVLPRFPLLLLNQFFHKKTPTSFISDAHLMSLARVLYSTKPSVGEHSSALKTVGAFRCRSTHLAKAQAALMDYLHNTRNLQFTDAEHISKYSPNFLRSLLQKVKIEEEIEYSVNRFLRYHPINEFEPFFESIGLRPSELTLFLPSTLIFLRDDALLLENYHVLCNYGIPRGKIGKLCKDATDIFHYKSGLLASRLKSYEDLGLNKFSVVNLATCCPYLLAEAAVNEEFVQVLNMLRDLGIESEWICRCLRETDIYCWSKIRRCLCFLIRMGYGCGELRKILAKHPDFLLDGSGEDALGLICLFLKLGVGVKIIMENLLQFPLVRIGAYRKNLTRNFIFIRDIEMEPEEVRRIMMSHPHILGAHVLRKSGSIIGPKNSGKRRLREAIKEDPNVLKKLVLGSKRLRLPDVREDAGWIKSKFQFLVNLGFAENSEEMKKAMKRFRGRGDNLQDRFECFVKAGLERDVVCRMIRATPTALNLRKDVIEDKIHFLVKTLGYPIEALAAYPQCILYSRSRLEFRLAVYNWLKDRGVASSSLALGTILATSDKRFIKTYVKPHSGGEEVWEQYKKQYFTDHTA